MSLETPQERSDEEAQAMPAGKRPLGTEIPMTFPALTSLIPQSIRQPQLSSVLRLPCSLAGRRFRSLRPRL